MLTRKRIIVSSVLYAIISILVAAIIVGSIIATRYTSIISIYFKQETTKWVNTKTGATTGGTGEELDTEYFKSDFNSMKDLKDAEDKLASDVQAEGSVLLSNKGGALPLKATERKVTLLGAASTKYLYGGAGSGAISTAGSPTMKDVFEDAGFTVNNTVWDLHKGGTTDANIVTNSNAIASVSNFKDAAIIFFSREGKESSDLTIAQLKLSDAEVGLVTFAKANFPKVIVLLNTHNVVELGTTIENVDACLWIGSAGQTGLKAVPLILKGTMYPSGRLVDTYAFDNLSSPAMMNYGSKNLGPLTGTSGNGGTYVWYAEGIYVGYKYYETRYEDKVMGADNVGTFDYAATVQFPFGFGLSYTTFQTTAYAMRTVGENLEFDVTVKNTGDAKGKEVVQIYMQSPYTKYDKDNGIEKASIDLVGFGKTKELAAGASEKVTVVVPLEVMRVYDSKIAKTYIVEAGEYLFAAGNSSHDAINNILASKNKAVSDGMTAAGNKDLVKSYTQAATDLTKYSKGADGKAITNQFELEDIKTHNPDLEYLTRNDWTGTFPVNYASGSTSVRTSQQIIDARSTTSSKSVFFAADPDLEMPTFGSTETDYKLIDMKGLAYEDPRWEDILDQLTAEEMYNLYRMGGYSNAAIPSIAKPFAVDKDGPAGISSTLIGGAGCYGFGISTLLACTWNTELAKTMGKYVGEDGLYSRTIGWYAPSMNIHRTPTAGRNFEYFSEDGFLSGIMGTNIVLGVQSKGMYAYIKHFAFNDQETGRNGIATFANEQTFREIYLRPFEMSIRDGHARGLMSAMNSVGGTWVGHHKGMMTNILRGEWGFQGINVTDQAMGISRINPMDAVWAGTDLLLNQNTASYTITDYAKNATLMHSLRRATKNILFTVANSAAMNGIGPDTEIIRIMPTWMKLMIALEVVVYVAAACGIALITYKLIRAKQGKSTKLFGKI